MAVNTEPELAQQQSGGAQNPPVNDDKSEIAHSVLRGVIGAQAMTGMRTLTVYLGLAKEPPPKAILRQRARGLLRKVPKKRRPAFIELFHWSVGAFSGAIFGMLPDTIRRRRWAGPVYGLAVWAGYEAGIAPALGLSHAKKLRPVERLAFAADHLLYGLVLSEMRPRPRD
jgi:hypothetical protein